MSDTHSTQAYRLDSGTHRTRDGVVHEPGDVVELTGEQYARYEFKFTPVDGPDANPDEIDVDGSIPDDWNEVRALASAWDGDEITGQHSRDEIEAFLGGLTTTQIIGLKQDAGFE